MKKRLTSLLLVFSILLSLLPVSVFATGEDREMTSTQTPSVQHENPFTDVKESDWFYDAVQYAQANGFFSGTSATTFAPGMTMTRGMFVTVLAKMAGVDGKDYAGKSDFADVSVDDYYAPYVAWASQFGITSGVGDGKFAPDALINREQMARFFVGYFEKFDVNYDTGANITTTPQDIDSVSSWARDSVLKLWKQGLLVGDGKNFNPSGNASRAEAAAVCMSSDKAVETWYSEPGVESTRVSVDPKAEQSEQPKPDKPKPQSPSGGGSSGGDSATTYYKVTIHCGDATSEKLYPKGTLLNNVVVPDLDNDKVFLGWFHDSELTQMAGSDEVLSEDIDLYAKVGTVSAPEESGKPSFIARLDIEESDSNPVTIGVKWADGRNSDIIPGVMKDGAVSPTNANVVFRNISNPLLTDGYYDADTDAVPDESVTIDNGVIKGKALFTPGSTYQIELLDEDLIFDEAMDNGEPADEYVRYFNFSIKKEEVMNLDLNPDMLYIPAGELSEADRKNAMEYVGLYTAVVDTETGETTYAPNNGNGSFSYAGEFKDDIDVGDTVAIYQGNVRPDQRVLNDTGEVVYLTITGISGTTYKYDVANHEDVLFTPDILPIDIDAGDGVVSNADGTLVINFGKLDFSSGYTEIGLDAATTVDVGDFLFFYTGDYRTDKATAKGYGLITKVSIGAENASISYTSVTEDVVLKAMEMFVEEAPSEEQIEAAVDEQAIRESVTTQIMESGFVAETGAYLTEMALMTDEVQSVLGEGIGLEDVTISLSDGKTISGDELELMDGNLLHKGENVTLDIAITTNLTHFEDASGVRVEVTVNYEFDIQKKDSDKKINVSLTAFFEQEVKLGISVSGEAIWKKAWIIPYIADYQLSANMDLGSYTGVGITAVAKTDEDKSDSGMPWPKTAAEKKGTAKVFELTKAIKEQMEETKGIFNEGENSASGELADKYSDMLEEADDSWIDLFVVNIYEDYQSVAPAYILAYAIKIDFVVSANLYVALGVTFQYEVSKRYSFAIQLNASNAASDVVETGTNGFRFDAYVMGTMGLRAGIRVKILAGLFTCKLDGIGIQAEAGAYIRLWGYFYFSYSNYKDMTADSPMWENKKEFTGALLIEIGAYLDVNFVAEVLDGKYAWTPSLYSTTWPFLQIGEPENVNDFAYEENDSTLLVEVLEKNTVTLPTSLFDMKYMDLTSGDVYGEKDDNGEWRTNKQGDVLAAKNFDGNTVGADGVDDEARFYITMSDERFIYDPTTNTVTIDTAGTVQETCEMTITWAGTPLAFTNSVPSRTVTINWSNPEGMRYIQFNSTGGSSVKMASGPERGKITWPVDPTKTGYTFVDWYTDAACTQVYNGSKTQLPENFGTNPDGSIIKGITLYSKWAPAPNRVTVEHYQQSLNNRYELRETESVSSGIVTDAAVSFDGLNKTYEGFAHNVKKATTSHATVQADGSTLVKLYYTRNKYTVTFNVNYPEGTGINVVNSIYFNADMAAAKALCPGYVFDGWYTAKTGGSQYDFGKMPAENVTVYAHWSPANDTPYTVAHYKQAASGGYVLEEYETLTGTTGMNTEAAAKTYEGFTVQPIVQQAIAADGSTSIICKYNRNTYTLTRNYNDRETNPTVKTEQVMFEATMKPADPTREGHEFSHWVYADADGNATETVFSPTDTMPGHDVTLIAKWDVNQYTLSYDLNGGKLGDSTTIADEVKDYGTQITTPTTPVRTGYTFAGWKDQETVYNAEATFNMPARDVKLVAQWTANSYTVNFDVNGDEATCGTENSSLTYDQAYGELPVPTRTGHDFVGWFTQAEGGDQVTAETMMTTASEHTLYAHWTIKQYTITFKNHDGTTLKVVEQNYKTAVTAPEVTREGYTFTGWYRGENEYEVGTMPAENVELYAKWTANNGIAYQIHIYRQNVDGSWPETPTVTSPETGTADSTVTVAADRFNATGFTYDSSKANVTSGTVSVDGSLVLKLYYTRNQHNFIVDYADGTTPNQSTPVYYGAAIAAPEENPTRTGYTFNGWNKSYSDNTMPDEDVTITAQWTANRYTITFDSNGGSAVSAIAQDYGTAITAPAAPTRTGYTFAGWNNEIPATMPAEDMTITAKWTINQYIITFETGEGSSVNPIEANYGEPITAPENPTRTGYTFDGWNVTIPTAMPATDMTITAEWTPVSYGITYDLAGGAVTGLDNPGSYTIESEEITLTNPTRTGYTFLGWTGTDLDKATVNVIIPTGSTGDRSYTATWTAEEYSITLNLNDGTLNGTVPSTYTIESEEITLPTPTRTGHTFAGWTGTGLSSASTSVTIGTGNYGDRSYTATWDAIEHTMTYNHSVPASDFATGVIGLLNSWTVETTGVTNNGDGTLTLTLPTLRYNTRQYTFNGYSGTDITYENGVYKLTVNADTTQIYVDVNWTENETKLTIYSDTTGEDTHAVYTTAGNYELPNTITVGGTNYYIPGWKMEGSNEIIPAPATVTLEAYTTKAYQPSALQVIANNTSTTYTYDIYTGDQLKLLGNTLPSYGKYVFNLRADIVLTNWTGESTTFGKNTSTSLTFNGNDHTIHFGDNCTAPLFGYLTNADFSYLTTTGTITSTGRASALIMEINSYTGTATFEKCTNKAEISGSTVGGLVAYVYAKTTLSFTDCKNSGTLTGTASSGGLLGYSRSPVTFTRCTNTGNIDAAGSCVGGLVGSVLGEVTVSGCTVSGTLTGTCKNNFVGSCNTFIEK